MSSFRDNLRHNFNPKQFLCYFPLEIGGYVIAVIEIFITTIYFIYELIPQSEQIIEIEGHEFYTERLDLVITSLISLISCGLVIFGVHKRNHYLLLPWMTVCFFMILVLIVLGFYIIISFDSQLILIHDKILVYILLLSDSYAFYIMFLLYRIFSTEYQSKSNLLSVTHNQRSTIQPTVLTEVTSH